MTKGNISVNTQNILPIIKKWLYSDKDIFLREIVSNGCDAIRKLELLAESGEAEAVEGRVAVTLDKETKSIIIEDNGLGMTADEVTDYITRVAFSGAEAFLEKYKDKDAGIIGHFGLGFYSSFMVSERVDIETLSYRKDAKPVFWSCDGGEEYEMDEGKREKPGTAITLHISEENAEFLDEGRLREILRKYCAFLRSPIYFCVAGGEDAKEPINDTEPLWNKKPSDCTDEEYKAFYQKVFFDFNPPLFWVHLNVDYPFNLKGILYFPKLKHEFETAEGQVKLYNNQVFVADNVKEVIPEFLLLLKGCVDCPDMPLNVSRSFLQNDGYAQKVSAHITKKVADKLNALYNTEKENYLKYWDDIAPFIKYGCIRDEKFYDKVADILLLKTTDDAYMTVNEYVEEAKDKEKIYYVSESDRHAQYVSMYAEQGIKVVCLPHLIDNHFITFLETKKTPLKFKRIDSDMSELFESEGEAGEHIKALFAEALGEDVKPVFTRFKNAEMPAMMALTEESRRMAEMAKAFGGGMSFPEETTLNVNLACPLVAALEKEGDRAKQLEAAKHIYDLAMLAHKPLTAEQIKAFIKRSADMMHQFFNV